MKLLSVDAWREPDGGWTWNNWHKLADVPAEWCDLSTRALFRELRAAGYLAPAKMQRARLTREDDGYNVVIKVRGTDEPILAIEYGSEA